MTDLLYALLMRLPIDRLRDQEGGIGGLILAVLVVIIIIVVALFQWVF
jgi:hypothetical protein